ncbi:hypothetical protein EJ05DRAFT_384293, partial [Pseudovirgaria hyperparasitica]
MLQQKLFYQKSCRRTALVGLGGVGKTQVALQLAYWVRDNQPKFSVFWIAALSAESFKQSYIAVLKAAGVAVVKDEDPMESFYQYIHSSRAGKWLLILDNADDVDMLNRELKSYGGLTGFFPAHEDGLIVFTTRHREAARSLAGRNTVDVQEMDHTEARQLFDVSLPEDSPARHDRLVIMLLEELSFHPLAITQAAAYLDVTQTTIADYLTSLRGTEKSLISLMSREFGDDTRYSDAANAVATTWLVSFAQIQDTNDSAAQLLEFLSQIEPRAIPLSLLPRTQSDEDTLFAVGVLQSYAFIARRGSSTTYDMHRLVHLASKIWIEKEGQATAVNKQATEHIAQVFPLDDYTNRGLWQEYLPHATRLARNSTTQDLEERYTLCSKIGLCLYADGRMGESMYWLLVVDEWRKEHLGEEHPSRRASQHALAGAYEANGQV